MIRPQRYLAAAFLSVIISVALIPASASVPKGGRSSISPGEMKEWLTYLASDELEGRATFSEGLGIAAEYIAEHLRSWGVRPGGDNGSYFQRVSVLGVKSTNNSTVTVEANGETRTFKNGEGIGLGRYIGGKRSITADKIEFMGYGLNAPQNGINDYAGRDVRGKVVVYLGTSGPKELDQGGRRLLFGRARYATEQAGAAAAISPGIVFGSGGSQPAPTATPPAQPTPGRRGFGQSQLEPPDFTTVQRLDAPNPPTVTAADSFLEYLFSGQEKSYADLKAIADKREALPKFTLKNVKITINLDVDYRVVRTQYTRNVVGIVDGRDTKLKDTYVAFGAHYDHVGYAEGDVVNGRRVDAKGRVKEGAIEDRIWNGADDDGSGTVTLLSLAKAFAYGSRTKRSAIFVWHCGEERGLWGSHYFVEYPTVPLDKIVAQLNMDMVGRNRNDKPEEGDTIYIVGSDRISTELHNLTVAANEALDHPMKLDCEMNDPSDPEQIYTRSDHYSYASKGIPIVFFTTGLHPDYHVNTDSPEKISYEKMARIGQLVYQVGAIVANLGHAPMRDNLGPRAGKGSPGKIKT